MPAETVAPPRTYLFAKALVRINDSASPGFADDHDEPIIERARRLLARAALSHRPPR